MPVQKTYVLRLDSSGRVTLPPELRERLGVKAGDTFALTPEADGSFWLRFPPSEAERQAQAEAQLKILDLFGTIDPEDMLTDEEMRAQRKRS